MNNFLFIAFSIFNFLNPLDESILKYKKINTSQSIAMISNNLDNEKYKEVGNFISKLINTAATTNENCRQITQTEIHRDGSTTDHITITCSKKIKKDKNGKIKSETDISKPKFQAAKKIFFEEKRNK